MLPLPIKISRDGQEIGCHELPKILELFAAKHLLPTDHYWQPGMTDWKPLTGLIAQAEELRRKARLEKEREEAAAQAKRDEEAEKRYNERVMKALKEDDGANAGTMMLSLVLALPFLIYGSVIIWHNLGRGNFAYGETSTAMTNGLLFFGIGVLIAKK